MEYLAF